MACLLAACSTAVDFGEQYKKVVYIINSENHLVKTTYPMAAANEGSITVYCGGTELSGKDITIRYKTDTSTMNTFNKSEYGEMEAKYMVAVPEEAVTFHQPHIIIKAGEEYGILNFSVNTLNLDLGVINTIPITITETSEGEINPKLQTLFYTMQIMSPLAGKYDSKINSYTFFGVLQSTKIVQKKTQTVSRHIIRVPLQENQEVIESRNNYYDITLNEEDNTVTLTSPNSNFLQMKALTIDGVSMKVNYYNPETKEFIVAYKYPSNVALFDQITTYEVMKQTE